MKISMMVKTSCTDPKMKRMTSEVNKVMTQMLLIGYISEDRWVICSCHVTSTKWCTNSNSVIYRWSAPRCLNQLALTSQSSSSWTRWMPTASTIWCTIYANTLNSNSSTRKLTLQTKNTLRRLPTAGNPSIKIEFLTIAQSCPSSAISQTVDSSCCSTQKLSLCSPILFSMTYTRGRENCSTVVLWTQNVTKSCAS